MRTLLRNLQYNIIIPVGVSPLLPEGPFFIEPVVWLEDHIRQNEDRPQGEPYILQISLQVSDT